jgi:hypothetical protein
MRPAQRRGVQPVRALRKAFVVAPPAGARIRTRLRVAPAGEVVLRAVGEHLGRLAGKDLAERCRLGTAGGNRARRKRELTGRSSSRWAGAVTRTSDDQWQRGRQNLIDAQGSLDRAIRAVQRRLAVTVGKRRGRVCGYATAEERYAKRQRLQGLQARLGRIERRLQQGHVSVVRGGRRLARTRHHLEETGLAAVEWRTRWEAERWFLCADGEADKRLGNETIRVDPEAGWLELKLPAPIGHMANASHGRYRPSCPVRFAHRGAEWAAQAVSGAIRYDLHFEPDRGRWYCSASWTLPASAMMTVEQAIAGGVLAVDVNVGHLACWQVDRDGNPVGTGVDIALALDGMTASTRDGRLRGAISALLEVARQRGCTAIAIEDLDFADVRQTGRETLGRGRRGKRFRSMVTGLPTRQFRDRLAQMAANRGIMVVAVDPGWTSVWGQAYWRRPLQDRYPRRAITRHHAACVVLGRRALGLRARRRQGVPAPHQRMEAAGRHPAGAESYRPGRAGGRVRAGHDPPPTRPGSPVQEQKTPSGDRARARGQVAQDRSVSPVSTGRR